ncbi:MAG: aspartate/glutamate racemase family protein [Pseudomonadota bacterium]
MKTIGLIGGMSPESTMIYYRALNHGVRMRLGGYASAQILMKSLNFAEIRHLQTTGEWDLAGFKLAESAAQLEHAGADLILLATNTMHKCASAIEAALKTPFLHIADTTANRLLEDGRQRPGLMGTAFTMEEDFYIGRLQSRGGLDVVVPNAADRAVINAVIFNELVHGVREPGSVQAFLEIAGRLKDAGADSLILGCTEVGMLVTEANSPLPVFDTALIHVEAATNAALSETDATNSADT